jgi:hypothetical protein
MKGKFILDACCGPKLFWFNKNHPNGSKIPTHWFCFMKIPEVL